MAGLLPPVVATLLADISEFSAKMDEARGEMSETEDSSKLMGAAVLGITAAVGAVGFEAVKMGSEFQSQMELLVTQAGVPQSQLSSLETGVLNLAGSVGFSPDSLAEALYHIESSFASVGITGSQAMNLLQVAAEGAATGHADLVDVTNALDAAVVSGIPGVQNLQQAMGVLNATIGAGDMDMQDLANAFSTGLLANVKSYGLSITDVGAALAVFGDNNIRGQNAATDLRMAVQALAVPAASAAATLQQMGLSTHSLADVMSKEGLLPALELLHQKMNAIGVTEQNQGEVLTELFGKKAGAGIVVLYDQLDRLQSKYPVLTESANNFGTAWEQTKGTFSQAMKSVQATVEALITELGLKLMPILTRVANWFVTSVSWIQRHREALIPVAIFVGGALAVAFWAAATAVGAFTLALVTNPIFLVVAAIAALTTGVVYAYTHFKAFRDVVADVAHFFEEVWDDAMKGVQKIIFWFASTVLPWLKDQLFQLEQWWRQHGQQVVQVVKEAWVIIRLEFHIAVTMIKAELQSFLDGMKILWTISWDVVKNLVKLGWDFVRDLFETAFHLTLNAAAVFFDLLTGHWSQAWKDAKKLVHQGLDDVGKLFSDFAGNAIHLLYQAGKDIITGLINGVKDMWHIAENTVKGLAGDVESAFKSMLGISSPSRVFYQHGQNIIAGLVLGIQAGHSQVSSAVNNLARATGFTGAGAGFGSSIPGMVGAPGGIGANGAPTVEIYLDGQKLQGAVRKQTLRYDRRNSGNNLALVGRS